MSIVAWLYTCIDQRPCCWITAIKTLPLSALSSQDFSFLALSDWRAPCHPGKYFIRVKLTLSVIHFFLSEIRRLSLGYLCCDKPPAEADDWLLSPCIEFWWQRKVQVSSSSSQRLLLGCDEMAAMSSCLQRKRKVCLFAWYSYVT